jgi:hypothetical protein
MKTTLLFIAAMLLVFCIVPISTTQAMPQRKHGKDSFASTQPNDVLAVFNQSKTSDMVIELSNSAFKDNVLARDVTCPQGTTIAQVGKSTTTTSTGKTNPHVKRRGRGRSKMGDAVVVEDNNSKNEDTGDEEEDGGAMEEDEEFGDDSAIKYNKGLKNSSGYNQDL